jgi:hypothetical protein
LEIEDVLYETPRQKGYTEGYDVEENSGSFESAENIKKDLLRFDDVGKAMLIQGAVWRLLQKA